MRRHVAIDPLLVGAALALAVLGTIMVGSASISLADNSTGSPFYYLTRHLGALAIGGIGFTIAARTPMRLWYQLHWLFLLGGLALLAVVLVPSVNHTVNGSSRWLALGPVTLQPSEPARLALLFYISSYCVRHHGELTSSFTAFLKPLAVVALAGVLLLAEPDFGAVVVLTGTALGVLFVAGARLRDVLLAVGSAGAVLGALAYSAEYRIERLTAFLDPWADPFASGFQLTQSLIAIGRGDWLGVGLGQSVQKLFYLPEAHTDFVFAVLAEELGILGSTTVIALFALLVWRAIAMGQRAIAAGLPFQGLVATAIGLTIGVQAFINIGVNTGLLPTKGLTLPLLSYGRSSTVMTLIALGLLVRVGLELGRAEPHAAGREGRAERGRKGSR
ncbi:MAG: putative lipid II flippase FtsW [Gammaproteobacteria bacterium]|nr:putative lipid II flippase FtsW [Gammaproteobacteria bacterium]